MLLYFWNIFYYYFSPCKTTPEHDWWAHKWGYKCAQLGAMSWCWLRRFWSSVSLVINAMNMTWHILIPATLSKLEEQFLAVNVTQLTQEIGFFNYAAFLWLFGKCVWDAPSLECYGQWFPRSLRWSHSLQVYLLQVLWSGWIWNKCCGERCTMEGTEKEEKYFLRQLDLK